MTTVIAIAGLLAVITWYVRVSAASNKDHARRSELFAYMWELRQITGPTALLTDRIDEAAELIPGIGKGRLRQLRDDGIKYASLLTLGLIQEFEGQHPSWRNRLGHSLLRRSKRDQLDALFLAGFGHKPEVLWTESDDEELQQLAHLLSTPANETDSASDALRAAELARRLEKYSCDLGKLLGNFQSLEYILRWFLYQQETNAEPSTLFEWYSLRVGDQVPINAFTNYDSLGVLIDKYNRRVMAQRPELKVDLSIVELRDAIAHGRVSAPFGTADIRLMKFSKPTNGAVTTVFTAALNAEWMEEQRAKVMNEMRKVGTASGILEEHIGPIPS